MVTDLVEMLRYHDLIERGVSATRLVHVGRMPAWLGSSQTRLVESVPRPDGSTWRVFRSPVAIHVLVPAGADAWYVGDIEHPRRSAVRRGPHQLDHRLVSPRSGWLR